MSDPIIKVENLGKKYIISHQRERYTALRDVIVNKVKTLGRKNIDIGSKEEFWALKDVSFEIEQGDRVGIVGRNGAGKSTLLKLLSRITVPTKGSISIKGRTASLLEVGTGFHPELTGRENIYLNGAILGMSKHEIKDKFDEIVSFAEVEKFLDTPVKRYSSGMYVRLAFSVAAHLEPEILIVDEVLAVGDAQFQQKCLGKMEDVGKGGRTVLFVSHNINAISRLCNKGLYLDQGETLGIDEINTVIMKYLDNNLSSNEFYSDSVVKYVSINQSNDELIIHAEYDMSGHSGKIDYPCLGFVIYDLYGNPIIGGNPKVNNSIDSLKNCNLSGKINVVLKNPKILDGTYKLSIWFANGEEHLYHKKDCIVFNIIGMVKTFQLPINDVGCVYPECDWFLL